MSIEKKNHIVEEDGKFKLLSHEGKNLGVFDTREAAEKHEREVEYFKRKDNASDYPSFYYAKHMAPGLCGYENENILIDEEAIKRMIPTFVRKPVVVMHQDINLDNLEKRDGTVIESFYNDVDGCLWVKMLIETDAARQAINQAWSVSNCYAPIEWGGGGMHHNIAYDRKIVNGEFKHLAIVPNPRYEEAKIYTPEEFKLYQQEKKDKLAILQNAKENKKMLKFFKNKKEEVSQIDEDTMITLENGKDVSVKEMMAAVIANAKKNESEKEKGDKDAKKEEDEGKEKVNMDTEVDVDGEKLPIRELVNRYNKMNKKNTDDEEEKKKKAEKEKENKKNEEETEEEKKKKAEEMKNAIETKAKELAEAQKHYFNIMNASTKQEVVKITTISDKVQAGKDLYGSSK